MSNELSITFVSTIAWGNRRNPYTWTGTNTTHCMFDRGFTGHEMLYDFGLINMNGRMYDPVMSSFLSVDRYVQNPENSQNFNRYSYCLNNPLKYVADHIDRCNNIDGTGFHAEMYYNEVTDTYVISIEGSKDSDDWVFNNARNAVNADVPQYILAKQIGDVINSIPQSEREKLNLEIVGHSLGGGVASVIGLTTGLETKTFNASRVPNNFLEENGLLEKVTNNDVQNITAYHTSNDILTNIQQSMGSPAIGISRDIGSTGGVTETVIRGSGVVGTAADGIAGHKMSSVVNIISNSNNEKKKAEWDKLRKAQYQLQRELRSAEMKKLL